MNKNIFTLLLASMIIPAFIALPGQSKLTSLHNNSGKNNNVVPWSVKMTDALIERNPKLIVYDIKDPKWNYEQGLVMYAIWNVWEKTKDKKYFNYIKNNVDYYVNEDGRIKTYNLKKYRLDDIAPGRILLYLYKATGQEKYKKAAMLLRKQLEEQPRTKAGGFWHKEIYPHQMWLDGLYMAEPFYAMYAKTFGEKKDFDDIGKQFLLMYKHSLDKKTGLLYHGWDESKEQKWADPKTGDSPSLWGRSMGWYLMGLVDVLDYFPKNHPDRKEMISIFKKVCANLWKYRDRKTDLWYLIVDKPGAKGNYLEASASAMFMYVYAKGAEKGYLPKKYLKYAEDVFKGLTGNLIKTDKDGYPSIYNTISSAGLGGKPYRDGTLAYYAGEPKRTNDFKAIGPFILGTFELEKTAAGY